MAAPPATRDAEVQALGWQIYDEMQGARRKGVDLEDEGAPNISGEVDTDQDGSGAADTAQLTKQIDEIVAASLAYPGCLLKVEGGVERGRTPSAARTHMSSGVGAAEAKNGSDTNGAEERKTTAEMGTLTEPMKIKIGPDSTVHQVLSMRKAEKILGSASLLASLEIAERKIGQNLYYDKHLSYRDVPELFDANLQELEEEARRQDAEDVSRKQHFGIDYLQILTPCIWLPVEI